MKMAGLDFYFGSIPHYLQVVGYVYRTRHEFPHIGQLESSWLHQDKSTIDSPLLTEFSVPIGPASV